MRKIIATAVVGMIGFTLAGCSTSPTAKEDAGSGTESVTMWGWRQDKPWAGLIEEYNATNPKVRVDYQGYKGDEYNQVLQTGLSGDSGPDLVMLRSYGGLETVVAGGSVAPIDEDVPELSTFPDDVLAGARSVNDDKMYGVPFTVISSQMFYNTKLLEEVGLEEPKTWDEFITLCDKLKAVGHTPIAQGALDSWTLPVARDIVGASAYDGPEFQKSLLAGKATFEDPAYAKANQALLNLKPYFPKGFEGLSLGDSIALFASGKAAMLPGGIWLLADLRKQAPDMKIGLFSAPRLDGSKEEPFTMGYVDGALGMASNLEGEEREGAVAFLKWATTKEFGQYVADELLSLPAVPEVASSDELLREATEAYTSNPTPYLTYTGFDYGSPSGTSLEYDNLQRMMLGEATGAEVGSALQEGISQWFKPSE